MAKIGLFYGSSTGNTEYVAYQIKDEFDKRDPALVDVINIGSTTPEQFLNIPPARPRYSDVEHRAAPGRLGNLPAKVGGQRYEGQEGRYLRFGDQNGYGFNFLDAVGMFSRRT